MKILLFVLEPSLEPALDVHLHKLHGGIGRKRDRERLIATMRVGNVREEEIMEGLERLKDRMILW